MSEVSACEVLLNIKEYLPVIVLIVSYFLFLKRLFPVLPHVLG